MALDTHNAFGYKSYSHSFRIACNKSAVSVLGVENSTI